ncbi:45e28ab4-db91-47ab-ad2c-0bbe949dfc39-CDS [Sclerotinia trifoliorum]|uniref:45e28ab4-db91-47ab-ad2c-0bbe949dfc39-CDS n=1 Tax=Sclerotinia trifoliorum TaxID=28548 RepID=A0A8H2ZNS2_9HELO|nr:45e28ab4-db91-47ab-ad2c-0bbe949dfc39-CDS [Sclerotinia trifoliorum]
MLSHLRINDHPAILSLLVYPQPHSNLFKAYLHQNISPLKDLIQMSNKHHFLTSSQRHQALLSRDPLAHSSFIYCVITTKIYCRPTCPSRLARRANIVFHETWKEAEDDGFRACKRCRPDIDKERLRSGGGGGTHSNRVKNSAGHVDKVLEVDDLGETGRGKRIVDRVMKLIENEVENGGEKWTLRKMAKEVGLTESHFCRIFKREAGVTMGEYRKKVVGQQQLEFSPTNNTMSGWNAPPETGTVVHWNSSWDEIGDTHIPDTDSSFLGRGSAIVFDTDVDGMEFLNLECCGD